MLETQKYLELVRRNLHKPTGELCSGKLGCRVRRGAVAKVSSITPWLPTLLPALRNFGIIARHNVLVVLSVSFCRSGRWHGRTFEALATLRLRHSNDSQKNFLAEISGMQIMVWSVEWMQ